MKKKTILRQLNASMNDSYSTAELYSAFKSEIFSKPKTMDIALIRETSYSLDDRDDGEVAPHKNYVWQKIRQRIQNYQSSFVLGMPRKRFVILIAAVIMLIATVTLAVTNWNVIISFIYHLETEESQVEKWSVPQKEEIIEALKNTGYDMSGLPALENLDFNEKNTVLTQWLKKQFDGEVNSDHYNLMIKLNGFFDDWSLEDKAWYYQMLLADGAVSGGSFVGTVPANGQKNVDSIIRLAYEKLTEAYLDTDLNPDCLTPYLFYGYIYPDDSHYYWRVHFRDAAKANWFTIDITDDASGEVYIVYRAPTTAERDTMQEKTTQQNENLQSKLENLEAEKGLLITWSYQEQAELFPDCYGIPVENQISQQQAYSIARTEYANITGTPKKDTDSLYCYSYYIINTGEPYYAITLFADPEATVPLEFSIEIYGTGEIKEIYNGNNG